MFACPQYFVKRELVASQTFLNISFREKGKSREEVLFSYWRWKVTLKKGFVELNLIGAHGRI